MDFYRDWVHVLRSRLRADGWPVDEATSDYRIALTALAVDEEHRRPWFERTVLRRGESRVRPDRDASSLSLRELESEQLDMLLGIVQTLHEMESVARQLVRGSDDLWHLTIEHSTAFVTNAVGARCELGPTTL